MEKPLQLREILASKMFGIPVSLSVGILGWSFGTVITSCRFIDYPLGVPQSEVSGCESRSLIGWVVNHGSWPYAAGYWEPYGVPAVLATLALAVWFGLSFFLGARPVREVTGRWKGQHDFSASNLLHSTNSGVI
ncbi:MAG: hypothetical protein ACREBU_01295 [Nitrososphaera sp.]